MNTGAFERSDLRSLTRSSSKCWRLPSEMPAAPRQSAVHRRERAQGHSGRFWTGSWTCGPGHQGLAQLCQLRHGVSESARGLGGRGADLVATGHLRVPSHGLRGPADMEQRAEIPRRRAGRTRRETALGIAQEVGRYLAGAGVDCHRHTGVTAQRRVPTAAPLRKEGILIFLSGRLLCP
jgi:hypothetical protein